MCTSNLIEAMVNLFGHTRDRHHLTCTKDPAFLDRVARKHFIPLPCAAARYEILRSKYLELADCGTVVADRKESKGDLQSSQTPLDDGQQLVPLDRTILPHFLELVFQKYSEKDCEAQMLWQLAEKSQGLSGRTLRDLPEDSLSLYTTQDPCPIKVALAALSCGVEENLLTRQNL